MKKAIALLLLVALSITLCACGKKTETVAASDQSKFTWQIQVASTEVKDKLHTDEGIAQYDGGISDVAYDNTPAEGNSFVILTMTVTKAQAGGGSFDWKKLSLKDAEGNSYSRMENDSFLSSHTYKRMPGTALQIGENKGSICFEIPSKAAAGSLRLCYDAGDEGINASPLSKYGPSGKREAVFEKEDIE